MDPWRSFRGTASSRAFTDRLTGCLEVNCTHIHTHTRTNRNETFSTHPDLNCIVYHHRGVSRFGKVMSTLGSIVMPIMMLISYVYVCVHARAPLTVNTGVGPLKRNSPCKEDNPRLGEIMGEEVT